MSRSKTPCACCPDGVGKLRCRRCSGDFCAPCYVREKTVCAACRQEERRREKKGYVAPTRVCCASRFNAGMYEARLAKAERQLGAYKRHGTAKLFLELNQDSRAYDKLGIGNVEDAQALVDELKRWQALGTHERVALAVDKYPLLQQYQRVGDIPRVMSMFSHCVTCPEVPEDETFGGTTRKSNSVHFEPKKQEPKSTVVKSKSAEFSPESIVVRKRASRRHSIRMRKEKE